MRDCVHQAATRPARGDNFASQKATNREVATWCMNGAWRQLPCAAVCQTTCHSPSFEFAAVADHGDFRRSSGFRRTGLSGTMGKKKGDRLFVSTYKMMKKAEFQERTTASVGNFSSDHPLQSSLKVRIPGGWRTDPERTQTYLSANSVDSNLAVLQIQHPAAYSGL